MPFDPNPANYIEDVIISDDIADLQDRGTCLLIPLYAFEKQVGPVSYETVLTASDGDDIRKIAYALIWKLHEMIVTKPEADRPKSFRTFASATETSDTRRSATFVFSFDLQTANQEVAPEP